LVEAIIDIVPNEKKLGFLRQIRTEHVTEKSEQGVIKGIVEYIKSIYVEVKPYVPTIIRGIQFLFKLWRGGL
jgi:hypothetical protein